MALGRKTPEQEAAKAAADQEKASAKAAAKAAADEAKAAADRAKSATAAKAAWLQSPGGQANSAYSTGQGFFELVMTVGNTKGTVHWAGNDLKQKRNSYTDALSQVENEGWLLEHVGYVWVQTGEVSRSRALGSGEQTAVSGQTQAIYLFRRRDK